MSFLFCAIIFNYIFEDADSLIVINDSLVVCGYHHYNFKVDVANSGKLKIRQWDGADSTGWLCLEAPLISIHGSSCMVGAGAGCTGGTISHPDGYGTGYGHAGDLSGGSGGGAGYGGAGGDGSDNGPGAGGIAYGNPTDTIIFYGSGGGAGRLSAVDGFGGNGGASFYAKALKIVIDSGGIACDGEAGDDGSLEAGGGGSGGGIMLRADSVHLRSTFLTANGGGGGYGEFGGGGGAGGGRIKIFYGGMLDTANLAMSASGGSGGAGGYGNGENGADGSIHVAPLVGINVSGRDAEAVFSIRPNPAKGIFQINSEKLPALVHIYDIAGRLVFELNLIKHIEFMDLGRLRPGVYFLKDAQDSRRVTKIILLK